MDGSHYAVLGLERAASADDVKKAGARAACLRAMDRSPRVVLGFLRRVWWLIGLMGAHYRGITLRFVPKVRCLLNVLVLTQLAGPLLTTPMHYATITLYLDSPLRIKLWSTTV